MSRPLYSLCIARFGSATAGTYGPVVPPGYLYIVRDIDAAEVTGLGTANAQVLNPVGGTMYFMSVSGHGSGVNFQWRGRQVYAEGEQVALQVFTGTWSIMVSGYQLTMP